MAHENGAPGNHGLRPAPADVRLQIDELTATVERDESVHKAATGQLQAASEHLREAIAGLLQSTDSEVPRA